MGTITEVIKRDTRSYDSRSYGGVYNVLEAVKVSWPCLAYELLLRTSQASPLSQKHTVIVLDVSGMH